MSTTLPSSHSAPSSARHRVDNILWEVVDHIFSFCDQSALFAISLVSFACWQLAGPILYEHVEIKDMDAIENLFFIKPPTSSSRLAEGIPLLSRIRNLTFDLIDFEGSGLSPNLPFDPSIYDDDDNLQARATPHRLLAYTSSPLGIKSLTILGVSCELLTFFPWLAHQIFPHLNPVKVIHRDPFHPFDLSREMHTDIPTSFLPKWTALERIEYHGTKILLVPGVGLYSGWTPPEGGAERRSFDIVFASTSQDPPDGPHWRQVRNPSVRLGLHLFVVGVNPRLVAQVDVRVTILADGAGEARELEEDVRYLPEWERKLVRVQIV